VEKNKEHVLAKWLLALTGDPNRVVQFGINYRTQKDIRFAWSQLVVPACRACNSHYGEALEVGAARILPRLQNYEAIPARDYLHLLDWLDKVRVGLWLNYQMIQGNPAGVRPNFGISDRIGRKDRMVAVYTVGGHQVGLNAYGVESLSFHLTPSCFALRVNNILLFNMSADFLFAERCGFPAPKVRTFYLDGPNAHMTGFSDFKTSRRIARQLLLPKLMKPVVQLFQPIMQVDIGGQFASGFLGNHSVYDSFIADHLVDAEGRGILFRQYAQHVEPIRDVDSLIEVDAVTGRDAKRSGDLVSQVYHRQNQITSLYTLHAEDPDRLKDSRVFRKMVADVNVKLADAFRRAARVRRRQPI
jgi:hypothetical protein